MTSNMYRVGDFVYFECVPNNPYQIRRIEELNKMANGSVEVRVTCFFRRRDLPDHLISMADKYETAYSLEADDEVLSTKQKHQLKLRELFITRQMETLPATHIRGKCSVTFLNETESLLSYLNCDDSFFYLFVYDPTVKTLTADRGEIRVGDEYQADIPPLSKESYTDTRFSDNEEMLVWTPKHNLTDEYIDKFLVVARSIGTFARALDCSSSVKQPSLHMTAAAASRDITLFHAMNTLHKHDYNISEAASSLIPSTGPALCRDELEEWSAAETNLFEQAMQKYKKNFKVIRNEFLSWKSLKSIVEYYYMWKTTDRYVQQKRAKALEAESKLKQVFIPNYDKPNVTSWNNNSFLEINGKHCDSCNTVKSLQWYSWDLTPTQCILCHECWCYWKKYGGLKISNKSVENEEKDVADEEQGNSRKLNKCSATGCSKEFKVKSHLIRHYNIVHGCDLRPGSRRPIMKTRTSFYLSTKPFHKLSRRLCQNFIIPQHIARRPFLVINVDAIKQAFQKEIASKSMSDLHDMRRLKRVNRDSLSNIVERIWSWHSQKFIPSDRNNVSRLDRKSYMKVNENSYQESVSNPDLERMPELGVKRKLSQEVSKADNRQYDEILNKKICRNALQDEPISSQNAFLQLNGKSRVAATARKKVVSLAGGSDDVYFKATSKTKNMRRRYSITILRRAARRPWREIIPKCLDETVVILD